MSIEGEPFIIDIQFPDDITSESVFEVKKNLTKNELEEFVKFCIEYENQNGKVNAQDPNFAMGMEKVIKRGQENFVYPDSFKFTDEHLPQTILSQALFKYSNDDDFKVAITNLQKIKEQLIRKAIFQFNVSQTLEEIEKLG